MQETVILGFDPLTERAVTLTQKSDRLLCDRKTNNLWVQRYIVYIHLGGWVGNSKHLLRTSNQKKTIGQTLRRCGFPSVRLNRGDDAEWVFHVHLQCLGEELFAKCIFFCRFNFFASETYVNVTTFFLAFFVGGGWSE